MSPPVAKTELKVPELEVFKKISMLSSLASACEDEKLVEAFGSMKHGSKLYEIFVKAVHQEIQSVISGKEQEAVRQMASVRDLSSTVYEMVQTMYNMMAAVSHSPILKVLAVIHDRMTGTSLEESLARSATMQKPSYQQPAPEFNEAVSQATKAIPQNNEMVQEQGQPSQNPPLMKKYADGRSQSRAVAPATPPRGRNIDGIF